MPFSERRDGTRSFDGDITGTNVELETDAGSWAYVGGELDLTNGNNGGANVVGGLGTNTVSVGNARIFQDNNGDNVANSGAPRSDADWGTFSIPRKGDRSNSVRHCKCCRQKFWIFSFTRCQWHLVLVCLR